MNKKIYISLLFILVATFGCNVTSVNPGNNVTSAKPDDTIPTVNLPPMKDSFIRGVDISMIPEIEALGGKYSKNGTEKDIFKILKESGVNSVRARLWVDPKSPTGDVYGGGNNDLARTIELGKRAKENGMYFLLDLHYSDFWADPGKQFKPKAWDSLTFENLTQKVYDYTADVMKAHKAEGVVPDMVQVGNELNSGMLWPDGKSWGQGGGEFERLSTLLKSGIQAVHDNDSGKDILIMLHLAKATDNGLFRWWFDAITDNNVEYDVIGMSYYPWWHGSVADAKANMEDVISRYNKPIVLVETSFPFTDQNGDSLANSYGESGPIEGYAVSVEGQTQYLKDIFQLMRDLPSDQGMGVYYWERLGYPYSVQHGRRTPA